LEPNSNAYASFTQGFKAGTLPGSAFAIEPVKPESINAWEVGYKTAGRVVRASVAGYYYNYKDIQVTTFGANGASITRNAASAHIYGLDGDLQVQVTPDLTLNLSAAYTHANYKDFPNAIATFQDLDPTSPTFPIFVNVNVDASGNAVLRAPRFSGSAGLNYRFGLAGGRMNLGGNLYYTSKFFFDAAHQLPQKGYPLLNLSATWTDPSDRFDVGLYGTNLTNAKYRTQNFIDTFANRQTWGDPIEVGAQLTYRY
jgi:iron complex outermembrane receptor protein